MLLSIITPTYNRADLLYKAYESLKKQTSQDFEWIIVDDGSEDNTKETVEKFILEQKIDIKYYYKENGGKHTAVNVGVINANGMLMLILDSDDSLLIDAVETINSDWKLYSQNSNICGLSYNRKITNLQIENKKVMPARIISSHIAFRYNDGFIKDRVEVYRTDVMKEYPFPQFENERFLSEAIVWNKIAYTYDTVYIDKDIYYCEYLPNGLTANSIKARVCNPKGAVANYAIMMKKPFKMSLRVKYSILYNAFSKFAKISFKEELKSGNMLLIVLTKIFGDIVYLKWKKYITK